jgi:hypothetical protein
MAPGTLVELAVEAVIMARRTFQVLIMARKPYHRNAASEMTTALAALKAGPGQMATAAKRLQDLVAL